MASRQIGSLWVRQSKGGITYMSGVLQDLGSDIQIAIFKNDRKEKENQPDYKIVLSEKKQEKTVVADDPFLSPSKPADRPSFEQSGYATKAEIEGPGKIDPADIPVVEDEINVAKIPF